MRAVALDERGYVIDEAPGRRAKPVAGCFGAECLDEDLEAGLRLGGVRGAIDSLGIARDLVGHAPQDRRVTRDSSREPGLVPVELKCVDQLIKRRSG